MTITAFHADRTIRRRSHRRRIITRDVFGKPTAITRSGYWNSTHQSATRHFVYNAQQRLCKRVDPESGATLLDYDAAGNLLWSARSTSLTSISTCQTASVPTNTRSTRSYDARNRLISITHPAGTASESYSYFADGALHTASTTDGGTWTYAYNKRRLPTAETLTLGAKTFSIGYGYTGLGHISTLTYPSGLSVSFNPNALGQPQQAGSYATGATYHANGHLAGFTYGNSLIHSQTLNSRGLPSRIRDRTSANVSRLDYSYSYDKHANITSIVDGVDANENRSLQYDARDRLTVATAANIYGEEIYDYDVLDNVRRMAAYPNGLGGYVQDYRYQYNANQRLTRIDNETAVQQWGFTHNSFGETLTRSGHDRDWYYQWNAAGRMTRADRYYGGSTWENYVYDAHGHRTRATRNTGTTRHQIYSRAGQLLYTEDTKDNQRIDYIHLGGKLVAQRSRPLSTSTATVTYHHTDSIQSANVETNTAGTQTYRTVRMPYGSPYNGVYREGPGFAGHVTYMQQRYYDPVAVRFLSPDPVDVSPTTGSNFNRYWYANNNPYKFIDPDGRTGCAASRIEATCDSYGWGSDDGSQSNQQGDEASNIEAQYRQDFGRGAAAAQKFADGMSTVADVIDEEAVTTVKYGAFFGIAGKAAGRIGRLFRPARSEVKFGRDANQIHHTFRHVERAGLNRESVQKAVQTDIRRSTSQIVAGKPFNQTISVGGKNVTYTAFRLEDGTINVGRIIIPE